MNLISGMVLIILFMYVFFSTTTVSTSETKKKSSKLLQFSIRLLQLFFILFVGLLMYELFDFLRNGEMELISSGFIDLSYSNMIDGLEIVLVTFTIMIISINFFILEVLFSILRNFDADFKFDNGTLKAIKMVSNLFIVRVFVQVLMNAVVYGSLTLSIEYVFIYALMIVIVNLFIKAVQVQEDSDLAI